MKVDPCEKETWKSNSFKIVQPTGETVYFAAETREELIHWLKVLVQEADKTKFSGKVSFLRVVHVFLIASEPYDNDNLCRKIRIYLPFECLIQKLVIKLA